MEKIEALDKFSRKNIKIILIIILIIFSSIPALSISRVIPHAP
jgi:hypothetical protein